MVNKTNPKAQFSAAKKKYFGRAALIIRGDKISMFYYFETTLIINRGKSDQNLIKLEVEVKNLRKKDFFLLFSLQFFFKFFVLFCFSFFRFFNDALDDLLFYNNLYQFIV